MNWISGAWAAKRPSPRPETPTPPILNSLRRYNIEARSSAGLSRYQRISCLTWDPSRERSGGGSRQMITTFPIRASSTITFTSKRATSAGSSSHKNEWTAKQPIAFCVKQWQQSVHLVSDRPLFTTPSELLARAGEIAPRNQTLVPWKCSGQLHGAPQKSQIVIPWNLDAPKLLQMRRKPLRIEQRESSRAQTLHQRH